MQEFMEHILLELDGVRARFLPTRLARLFGTVRYIYMCMHTHLCVHVHAYTLVCACACIHTRMHVCTIAHARARAHTHTHTHVCDLLIYIRCWAWRV